MPLGTLPSSSHTLVLRADFTDDTAWASVCRMLVEPDRYGFCAYIDCVSDPAYAGLTIRKLFDAASEGKHRFVFVVDATTFQDPERSVRVVDLFDEPGRSFRAIPSEVAGIQNNLSIANMDFHQFAAHADADGVFRGFRDE